MKKIIAITNNKDTDLFDAVKYASRAAMRRRKEIASLVGFRQNNIITVHKHTYGRVIIVGADMDRAHLAICEAPELKAREYSLRVNNKRTIVLEPMTAAINKDMLISHNREDDLDEIKAVLRSADWTHIDRMKVPNPHAIMQRFFSLRRDFFEPKHMTDATDDVLGKIHIAQKGKQQPLYLCNHSDIDGKAITRAAVINPITTQRRDEDEGTSLEN